MSSKVYGIILVLVAITIALIYLIGLLLAPGFEIFGEKISTLLIRYTVLVIMLVISGIIGYIGYLILTSPVPKPVEEIIKEYKEATK